LSTELARRGRLSVDVCIGLAVELTAALQHLHEHQLIHRDIKPSNIIFVKGHPKFADIGLVTDVAGDKTVSYVGTQGYMDPEDPGTPAADIYSLGKVLYEAMTGLNRERFPELPTEFTNGDISPQLFKFNRIVVKACEANVARRYQTAGAMLEDLRALLKR
jgi:serine/threonine protein kinase